MGIINFFYSPLRLPGLLSLRNLRLAGRTSRVYFSDFHFGRNTPDTGKGVPAFQTRYANDVSSFLAFVQIRALNYPLATEIEGGPF